MKKDSENMLTSNENIKILGCAGFARSGKDTFVSIAREILEKRGYKTFKLAFADELKNDIDDWLKEKYGISSWTTNSKDKELIRPFFVAHGCGKRIQTEGKYWIDKVNTQILNILKQNNNCHGFIFISDCRFINELRWIHEQWNGKVIHLKRYILQSICDGGISVPERKLKSWRVYDVAPNEEEAKNDPLVEAESDLIVEWESQKISIGENVLNNEYLQLKVLNTIDSSDFFIQKSSG